MKCLGNRRKFFLVTILSLNLWNFLHCQHMKHWKQTSLPSYFHLRLSLLWIITDQMPNSLILSHTFGVHIIKGKCYIRGLGKLNCEKKVNFLSQIKLISLCGLSWYVVIYIFRNLSTFVEKQITLLCIYYILIIRYNSSKKECFQDSEDYL